VRLFLAINLPAALRQEIVAAMAPLQAAAPAASWITEERAHLTLKFLGERSDSDATLLAEQLTMRVASHRSFMLELDGAGAFPNLRAPRVVWLGVADEPRLELLHHDVEAGCSSLGYEVEGRAFRPHITLARIRTPLDARSTQALAAAARAVRFRAEVEARSVDLMASALDRSAARYTLIRSLPLAPATIS
jgi:2'-5' RNA ligase